MKAKMFNIFTVGLSFGVLLIIAISTIVVDPYFHYHAPFEQICYHWISERYQNNGIVRNFKYDAIITGTSMTQNFKTSQMDELWETKSIKVPFSGGAYNEINDNLRLALETNENVKMVLRVIDYSGLIVDKDIAFDEQAHNFVMPQYLFDNNYFNDVSYVLNKDVISECAKAISRTINGKENMSFDQYGYWSSYFSYGKDFVLESFSRPDKVNYTVNLSTEDRNMVYQNVFQNVVTTALDYPDVTFYVAFPPYSICWWDCNHQSGSVDYWIEAERIAIEELLKCDNIRLFSFSNNFNITCNLDNYKDQAHYGEWINEEMMNLIYKGEYELTYDNYEEYLESIRTFYQTYDYDSIY